MLNINTKALEDITARLEATSRSNSSLTKGGANMPIDNTKNSLSLAYAVSRLTVSGASPLYFEEKAKAVMMASQIERRLDDLIKENQSMRNKLANIHTVLIKDSI